MTLSWLHASPHGGRGPDFVDHASLADLVDRDLPLPRWTGAAVAVQPPGTGAGYWAGAPTAVFDDGVYYLAYRLRRPIGRGRGYANVIGRSSDGINFETICTIDRDALFAESLERPALVRTPQGTWRLYLSCATPGTAHWWVDVLEADDPAEFDPSTRRTVFPGSREMAVKDPVVRFIDGQWHLWASCHPLDDTENTDRMVTRYAVSDDGLSWEWQSTALAGRPGSWDARGVRVATVLPPEVTAGLLDDPSMIVAFYDGRANAAENWEERTGVAIGPPDALQAVGDEPAAQSPHPLAGLRYVDVIAVPGGCRIYYEASRADGAHELRTELLPLPSAKPRGAVSLAGGRTD